MTQIEVNGVTMNRQDARQALTVMQRGLKLLQTRGWCQGAEYNEDKDTFCAVGALREGGKGLTLAARRYTNATKLVGSTIKRDHWASGSDIIQFNDASGRRRGEVTGLFRKAINRTLKALGR